MKITYLGTYFAKNLRKKSYVNLKKKTALPSQIESSWAYFDVLFLDSFNNIKVRFNHEKVLTKTLFNLIYHDNVKL